LLDGPKAIGNRPGRPETDRLVNVAGGPGPPALPIIGGVEEKNYFFAFFFAFFLAAFFFAGIECPPPFGYRDLLSGVI
jgi:hypothetical protein